MRKLTLIIGLSIPIFFTGCTTVITPQSSGGSRADGIVEMSFDYEGEGIFQKTEVQWDKARIEANERCKAWGYHSAKPFNRGEEQCQSHNSYKCTNSIITVKFQCIK